MTIKLKRITTQYIPLEDRIRLLGADENGQTLTLWLTQRLLNRLVTPLCEGLEKQTTPAVSVLTGPSVAKVPLVQTHLVQTFAQQKAQAVLPKDGPVVLAPQSPHWLVESVVMKQIKNDTRLLFKGLEAADRAELTLSMVELRQWLGIVFKQSKSAAWPTHVWPAWVEEAAKAPPPVASRSLH
jgi:hypothetical protein